MVETVPDVRLFQAVVLQAVDDATMPPRGRKGVVRRRGPRQLLRAWKKRNRQRLAERDEARAWLLGGENFDAVCRCAELDPDYVRTRALTLAALGWPRPSLPAKEE